jgi:mono/diheme cytochrome c family protein
MTKFNLAIGFAAAAGVTIFTLHLATPSVATAASDGKAIFDKNCASCHQANGKGTPGAFPPLADNKDVTAKDPTSAIKIVLNGLNTPKTINGQKYSGGMPPWKSTLSNADIAAVLTYVRSSWGNKAPAVTEKQVAAAAK